VPAAQTPSTFLVISPTRGWSHTPVKSGFPFASRGAGLVACAATVIGVVSDSTIALASNTMQRDWMDRFLLMMIS
jgi:hypothetical protein